MIGKRATYHVATNNLVTCISSSLHSRIISLTVCSYEIPLAYAGSIFKFIKKTKKNGWNRHQSWIKRVVSVRWFNSNLSASMIWKTQLQTNETVAQKLLGTWLNPAQSLFLFYRIVCALADASVFVHVWLCIDIHYKEECVCTYVLRM